MKKFVSEDWRHIVNFFRKRRLVLKNGVSERNNKAINIEVLILWMLVLDEFVCVKDIVNIYFLKRNCSWENVLCAIGVFKFVNLDWETGCTKKEGTCTVSVEE